MSEPAELTDVQRRVMRLLFNSAEPLWALALARSTGIPYGTVYDTFRVLYDRGWAVGDTEINIKGTGRPARVLYRLTETGRTEAAKILGDG